MNKIRKERKIYTDNLIKKLKESPEFKTMMKDAFGRQINDIVNGSSKGAKVKGGLGDLLGLDK